MLKILIVDDEMPIRQGLSVIISDFDSQFKVVGEAANGYEALALMEEKKPDLVITDIKMPSMDGVELVTLLSERYPDVKKVVLSGFDDFEFVREVMKKGVLDYLLKPVVEAHLYELLVKINSDFEVEQKKRMNDLNMNIKLNESMPLLRDQFLQQFVCLDKGKPYPEYAEKMAYYNINLVDGLHFVMLVHLDNSRFLLGDIGKEQLKIHQYIVKNIAQESVAKHAECYPFYYESLLVIVCSIPQFDSFDKVRKDIAVEVYHNLKTYTKLRFSICMGSEVEQFEDVFHSYASALTGLEHRFYQTDCSLLDVNRHKLPEFGSVFSSKISSEMQKGWLDGLSTGETRKIMDALKAFIDYHSNLNTQPSLVLIEMGNVFMSLQSENTKFRESVIDCCGNSFSYVKFLDQFDTLDEIRRHTVSLFADIIRRMKELTQKREKKSIQQVKEYINEHYRDEITLGKMADLVFINANYLSELFKTQCGINFIDYITQVRIDKAKYLLRDSKIKTYTVGEMVGYEDPAYFSKVFKKMIGVSPSEYRSLVD